MKVVLLTLTFVLSSYALAEGSEPASLQPAKSIQELVVTLPPYAIAESEIRAIQVNKASAFQVWANSLKTRRPINTNKIREFMERIQNGASIPPQLLIDSPNVNSLMNELMGQVMYPLQGYSKINGRKLYSGDYSFFNEYEGKYYGKPTALELMAMDLQSENCRGFLSIGNSKEAEEAIENCFVAKDRRMELLAGKNADYGYLRALNLVTAIVDKDDEHACIASVYRKNTWITAAHCLERNDISYGRYILLPNGPKLIGKDDITLCKGICDVATIKAETPDIPEVSRLNVTPNLKGIRPNTQIFLPGLVQGSKISKNIDRKALEENFMWSDFGMGYCRVRHVYNGCISHTCSSIDGWSGAPIYSYEGDRINLLGVHSGVTIGAVSCYNKGDKQPTNYATLKPLYEGL